MTGGAVTWNAAEVQAFRIRLRMDIPAFARLLGVDTRTVYRWEAGESRPTGPAEAVLNALRARLDDHPDQAEQVVKFLLGAVAVGGLAYLIIKLLDGVKE